MERRNLLGKMKTNIVRKLIVDIPLTVKPGDEIDVLLEKLNNDLRVRNVFVVDDEDKLVGSIWMGKIVQYLFPMGTIISRGITSTNQVGIDFASREISDLMDKTPSYVHDDSTLSSIALIMIHERLNELPVVDDEMRLIGQVNANEIIEAYKTICRKKTA